MTDHIGALAWAWLIIVGGIMLIPKGPVPILNDAVVTVVLGVVSIALGGAAFIVNRSRSAARI
jgi:hypothetical protein